MQAQKKRAVPSTPLIVRKFDKKDLAAAASLPGDRDAATCDDCRAKTAFQAFHPQAFENAFNTGIHFEDWNIVTSGRRAVIVPADLALPSWSTRKFAAFIIIVAALAATLCAIGLARNHTRSVRPNTIATP